MFSWKFTCAKMFYISSILHSVVMHIQVQHARKTNISNIDHRENEISPPLLLFHLSTVYLWQTGIKKIEYSCKIFNKTRLSSVLSAILNDFGIRWMNNFPRIQSNRKRHTCICYVLKNQSRRYHYVLGAWQSAFVFFH